MARKFDKQAGDTIDIRDREFSIVGVLEPTLTAPDTTAVLPLEAAQRLLAENAPLTVRQVFGAGQLASQFVVYPEAGTDIAAWPLPSSSRSIRCRPSPARSSTNR